MTFQWKRIDVEQASYELHDMDDVERADGRYVLAEDAINREAVNAAKIATLAAQLRQWKARAKDAEDYIDETGK